MKPDTPSYLNFNNEAYAWKPDIDYRRHPELYRVGKGEQGVLSCEPYKSEIGPHWRFKDEAIAQESSKKIYRQFLDYLAKGEFVGADIASKYLQMGFTRARRYANYKGGRKYDAAHDYALMPRGTGQEEKAKAAAVFYAVWKKAEQNETYSAIKSDWKKMRG
ncbi:DUF4385 domain-containing protein [Mucilaginibacter aquaedulcis]|uniref:DUF4385 domain-containing protein n=1 Tax=Mucilaginibacter aquaedulcis TaxID=1187081 RepID=UPI0025B2D22A|nr:DUF4385 domain-containing protein [Mucilaginibacter aquaedulcis]MDN3550190.1 DUF4385 domain-containing protein [Mucilaginibacter aquaedulcis]